MAVHSFGSLDRNWQGALQLFAAEIDFPNKPLQLAFTLWASKSDLDLEMPSWPTPSSWVHTVHSWQNACYGNELTCPQWSFVQQMAFDIFRCILARRERVNLWSATHLACQAGDVSQMQIDFLQSQKSRCRTNIHTHTQQLELFGFLFRSSYSRSCSGRPPTLLNL